MKKVSILVPCYNEEQSLHLFVEELKIYMDKLSQYDWEVLLINDGSKDTTYAIIQKMRDEDNRINFLDLSRNFGQDFAISAGLDYVTGDCAIIMDADMQDPPSLIPQLLEKWEEGYDDVYAKRGDRGSESWLRRFLSLSFYRLLRITSRYDMLENVGNFRLLDKSCINAMRELNESERYMKGMFCWIGFRKCEVVFDRDDRAGGKSSYNLFSLANQGIDAITSFTILPLRVASLLGLLSITFAICYIAYILVKYFYFGGVDSGFTTLIICILFLGGVQLLSIGILGEYIGRIFNETKRRPVYIAREYNGEKTNIK